MKAKVIFQLCLIFLVFISCKMGSNDKNNQSFDDFCGIKPNDWICEVVQNSFDSLPIPKGVEKPLAIIAFAANSNENPSKISSVASVFIYVYDISKKASLEKTIRESMKIASCVPIFLGENDKYYIITSSCFVNTDFFSEKLDRKTELKKVFTKFDENLLK